MIPQSNCSPAAAHQNKNLENAFDNTPCCDTVRVPIQLQESIRSLALLYYGTQS
ncbi:MAG: hypothetical protein JWO45_61 [Spartobacteria bacterium]|nr:hypothetical protein [Spartobacteria bacterium]